MDLKKLYPINLEYLHGFIDVYITLDLGDHDGIRIEGGKAKYPLVMETSYSG